MTADSVDSFSKYRLHKFGNEWKEENIMPLPASRAKLAEAQIFGAGPWN